MNEEAELHLTVEAEDAGSASRQAQVLERLLLEQCPSAKVHRIRSDRESMDGGATLALALASPVLVELVKTLGAFFMQRHTSKIIVKRGGSSVTIEGASNEQMNDLLRFLNKEK
jgi:hypothetical protein